MKVLEINSVCGIRSTGRIAGEIADNYMRDGHEVVIAYGREQVPTKYQAIAKRIGSELSVKMNAIETRIFDNDGFTAKSATREFLRWADSYDPDLLWLHNLHGYYINIEELFLWIKSRPQMEVKWTLHDCWAFTGHCSYFTYANCNKWEHHCEKCIQKREYPASYVLDKSYSNFDRKREIFTGVRSMQLITPSQWLADLVKKSFLREYSVKVKHNTINLEVFKPTASDVKRKLGISGKKVVLGVAAQWQPSKGYHDFFELRKKLSNDYSIVMVGLTEKQLKELPANIIGIKNTNSVSELAELYTAADVFFNPTYEDNYPTVNLEAKACNTPVITYNSGGSPESVNMDCVFEPGDLNGVVNKISEICNSSPLN